MNRYKILFVTMLLAALTVSPFAAAEEKPVLGVQVAATPSPSPTPLPTLKPDYPAMMQEAGLGERVLLRNMRGDDVALVQERLYDLGYYMGEADGIYGKNTVRAVKAFQQDSGLEKVDGKAGEQTLAALFSEHAASRPTPTPEPTLVPTPAPSPTPKPDLSKAPFAGKELGLFVNGAYAQVVAGEDQGQTLYPLGDLLTRLGYTGSYAAGSWQFANAETGEEIALITAGKEGLCEGAMGSYQGLVFVTDSLIRVYAYGGEAYVTAPFLELVGLHVEEAEDSIQISVQ